jgi:hypothetical protein
MKLQILAPGRHALKAGPVFAFNYKDIDRFGWIVKSDEVS